jgi:ATP-dependent DNA helicase RecG
MERLVEAGLVEAHGVRKGRTYTLSPKVYKALGQPADYVRQAGFDPIQQEQMVLQFVRNHGRITRRDAVALCRIGEDQARRLLTKLHSEGKLRRTGRGSATAYESY